MLCEATNAAQFDFPNFCLPAFTKALEKFVSFKQQSFAPVHQTPLALDTLLRVDSFGFCGEQTSPTHGGELLAALILHRGFFLGRGSTIRGFGRGAEV